MRPDAPYFITIVTLSLTPDNFIRQGESAATHWAKIMLRDYCHNSRPFPMYFLTQ
jgi:hypothetical protein